MNDSRSFLRAYFGVLFEKQTYLNIAYMFAALPLGIFYFVLLMTGLSLGFSLAIVLVGIPILFAMAGVMQALARLERALNHVMLDGECAREGITRARDSLRTMSVPGVLDYIRSGQIIRGGLYLFAKFAYGIVAFSLAMTVVGLIAGFVTAPIAAIFAGESWAYLTGVPSALIVALFGVFGAPIGLQFLNGVSRLWRDFGASMLDEPAPGRYRYVRVEDDNYDDPFATSARKNDEKPKNDDLFADDDPFYSDDDLHIARPVRRGQDDGRGGS